MTNPIMIMGCSSDAGKSFVVTALCRHFANRGVRVAPFKAQNMSNNAAVTLDGAEIGRAQYLQALAARYLRQLREVHERMMTPETAKLPLPEVYDRVIGALAGFHRRNPGFQPLFYGSPTSAGLAEAAALLHAECIGRAEMMIAAHATTLTPKRRRLLATINVEVMKALLPLSEAGDERHRREVLAEIKKLLLGHMERAMAGAV